MIQLNEEEQKMKPLTVFKKVLILIFMMLLLLSTAPGIHAQGGDDHAASPVGARKQVRFDHYNSEDGLSQDSVFDILQDSKGFLWFATQDGLNRFDGYTFTIYKHNIRDENSLTGNFIRCIHEDKAGNLWIGTYNDGLNRFDPETETFTRYQNNPDNPYSISSVEVLDIVEDSTGALWFAVGGANGGLNKFDPNTETFIHYQHDPGNPNSLSSNNLTEIYIDKVGILWLGMADGFFSKFNPKTEIFTPYLHDPANPNSIGNNLVNNIVGDQTGIMWLGTKDGLDKFDPKTETFIHYAHNPDNPNSITSGEVLSLLLDPNGTLWIGTQNGLNNFDPETEIFTRYLHKPFDPASPAGFQIDTIYIDNGGILWVGQRGRGLSYYAPSRIKFKTYRNIPKDPNSLNNNNVRCIYVDQTGITWIGTFGGGVNKFDRETDTFTHYQHNPDDPQSLSGNIVCRIGETRDRILWFGTQRHGINQFDRSTETFTHYLDDEWIYEIYEDRTGTLWVAGTGFHRFDKKTGKFTKLSKALEGYTTRLILSIYEDSRGEFWFGASEGLFKFDRETETVTRHYQYEPNNPNSLSNSQVNYIHETLDGILWLATEEGLTKFDPRTERFTRYTELNGLPNNVVQGILQDDQGNLWLSTNWGLSKFNIEAETFRNYDVNDGLQGNGFNRRGCYKNEHGEMLFCGLNGFNIFHPGSIIDDLYHPPVVLTDFRLFNKSVRVSESHLQQPIWDTDTLKLFYKDDIVSFEFSALSYAAPEKNRYQYILDGYEQAWNDVDSKRRFATYTNLPAGDYTFRARATNSDGVWSDNEVALNITITPPLWQTWWAYVLYVVVAVGSVLGYIRWRESAAEAHRRELKIQVVERTEELSRTNIRLKELDRLKSMFIASMSHELRTPLNSIIGFTGIIMQGIAGEITEEQIKQLTFVKNSANHLLALINDIIDVSKIEAGNVELFIEEFDLSSLLQEVKDSLTVAADKKGLKMPLNMPEKLVIKSDERRVKQIIVNLVGNAVKFTDKGKIDVKVEKKDKMVEVSVRDTGIGMREEDLDGLFKAFSQIHVGRTEEGTGLGLYLSKKIADLLGGDISAESEFGKGSKFTFTLPLK